MPARPEAAGDRELTAMLEVWDMVKDLKDDEWFRIQDYVTKRKGCEKRQEQRADQREREYERRGR